MANISVGGSPWTPTLDPANGDLYVPSSPFSAGPSEGDVSVISTASNSVVARIPMHGTADIPTYDPANGDIYVPVTDFRSTTLSTSSSVLVISGATNTIVANLSVDYSPRTPTYDASNGNLYVASSTTNVSVISGSTNTVIATLPGASYVAPAYDPLNGDLYGVTGENQVGCNSGLCNVSVISGSTNTVIATLPGASYVAPAYDPLNGDLYGVTGENQVGCNSGLCNVSVISGVSEKQIGNISVGGARGAIWGGPTYDSANGEILVSVVETVLTTASLNLTAIAPSNDSVAWTVSLGGGQAVGSPLYDPQNQDAYLVGVDGVYAANVTTHAVVASVAVSGFAWGGSTSGLGIAYDPWDGEICVSDVDTGSFGFVVLLGTSLNQILGTIQVGSAPQSPTYDPSNHLLYVADWMSGSVSVIGVVSAPPTFLGLPTTEGYGLVAGVAVLALVGILVLIGRRRKKRELANFPAEPAKADAHSPVEPKT